MIVGRGGGSSEDLQAFNSELVADALFESSIPTISAVGHEDDFTLADLIADLRALTPTEAATKVSPNQYELNNFMIDAREAMHLGIQLRIQKLHQHLNLLSTRRCLIKPLDYLNQKSQRLDDLLEKFNRVSNNLSHIKAEKVNFLIQKLQSLSPLNILSRGYSITLKANKNEPDKFTLVTASDTLTIGDLLLTKLRQGTVISEVQTIS